VDMNRTGVYVCSCVHGADEKCIQNFSLATWRQDTIWDGNRS